MKEKQNIWHLLSSFDYFIYVFIVFIYYLLYYAPVYMCMCVYVSTSSCGLVTWRWHHVSQVRCLKDHGEFEIDDGTVILLKKNSQVRTGSCFFFTSSHVMWYDVNMLYCFITLYNIFLSYFFIDTDKHSVSCIFYSGVCCYNRCSHITLHVLITPPCHCTWDSTAVFV